MPMPSRRSVRRRRTRRTDAQAQSASVRASSGITVRFGKGGRSRTSPVSPATIRRFATTSTCDKSTRHPTTQPCGLAPRGTRFGYDGLG